MKENEQTPLRKKTDYTNKARYSKLMWEKTMTVNIALEDYIPIKNQDNIKKKKNANFHSVSTEYSCTHIEHRPGLQTCSGPIHAKHTNGEVSE